MPEQTTEKFQVRVDPKTGDVMINMAEWFQHLDTEIQEKLDTTYWDLCYAKMEEMVRTEHAMPRYNDAIFRLQSAFLTSEDAPVVFRTVVRALMQSLATAEKEARRYERAYWELYHSWPDDRKRMRRGTIGDYKGGEFPSDAEVEAKIADLAAQEADQTT